MNDLGWEGANDEAQQRAGEHAGLETGDLHLRIDTSIHALGAITASIAALNGNHVEAACREKAKEWLHGIQVDAVRDLERAWETYRCDGCVSRS